MSEIKGLQPSKTYIELFHKIDILINNQTGSLVHKLHEKHT